MAPLAVVDEKIVVGSRLIDFDSGSKQTYTSPPVVVAFAAIETCCNKALPAAELNDDFNSPTLISVAVIEFCTAESVVGAWAAPTVDHGKYP